MSLHRALGLADPQDSERLAAFRPHMIRASELQNMEFPPPIAYVDGLVLEGLGILGGKPKLGKSFWAFRAGLAIASGGIAFSNPIRAVQQAPVLYLALEDGRARLQDRIDKLFAPGEVWPDALTLTTVWPRFDEDGLDLLADAIDTDGYRVVFIDTLARVRTARKGKDSYQEDSDAMTLIHDLVRERPGLAVVVIHHNRKDDKPDDYIDALSGTTGITGVVDHIAVLQRTRGEADAVLRFTSRDAAEHDTAFSFNGGAWTELGTAAEYDISKARKEVLETVALLDAAALTDIADMAKKDKSLTLRMLRGLEEDRLVHQEGKGGPWRHGPNGQQSPQLTELTELTDFRKDDRIRPSERRP